MGTSVGKAIDWLVATLPTPVVAADPYAIVCDGWPTADAQSYVVIGRESPEIALAGDGQQDLIVLGVGSAEEDYNIPCHVQAKRPGAPMKPARDAAIALFDVVAHTIAGDRTLGGALLGGRYARIQKVSITQDLNNESNPGAGHMVTINFEVHCTNHYQP